MNDLLFAILQVCDGLEIYAGDELSPYLEDRIAQLRSVVVAYDALAPGEWAGDAQWYVVDADGMGWWHFDREPMPVGTRWVGAVSVRSGFEFLSLGLDWRLCKWQRPEGVQNG